MIIFRYLSREVIVTTLVVTTILVFIFMCNELTRYLSLIASGKYAAGMLIHILLLGMPNLFSLLLPLGFFMAILLVYGKLYADSEMVALMAGGMNYSRLTYITLSLATGVGLLAAILTLFIDPWIAEKRDNWLSRAQTVAAFQLLSPGHFKSSEDKKSVFYVRNIKNNNILEDLFIAERPNSKTYNNSSDSLDAWTIISAEEGRQAVLADTGEHYLITSKGYRYTGNPGTKEIQIVKFKTYGNRLPTPVFQKNSAEVDGINTKQLFVSSQKRDKAELQWRLSIPLSVWILAFLAIPLSQVHPREGRFKLLFPALIFYVVYVNLLLTGRSWIEKGSWPPLTGLNWVHLSFLLLAFILYRKRLNPFS